MQSDHQPSAHREAPASDTRTAQAHSHVETHTCVPGWPLIMSKIALRFSPSTALPSTSTTSSPTRNLPSLSADPPSTSLFTVTRPPSSSKSSPIPPSSL
eukprot:2651164-Rhodomonas_salina.3